MAKSTKRTAKQRQAWSKLPKWLRAKIRRSGRAEWSRRCRREFEHKCSNCSSNSNIEGHHIYFQALYPKLKFDLDNSLALCKECHDMVHTLYIKSPSEYFELVTKLIKTRKPIKRIKKRNPSGMDYFVYNLDAPCKFLIEKEQPELEHELANKPRTRTKQIKPRKKS